MNSNKLIPTNGLRHPHKTFIPSFLHSPCGDPLPDSSTTIQQLKDSVDRFKLDRDWEQYHTPQDLAVSISIEAAELLELFQWRLGEKDLDSEKLERVKEELADVMIYCLSLANTIDVDVATIVNDKIKLNAEKYPVGKVEF